VGDPWGSAVCALGRRVPHGGQWPSAL